MLILVSLGWIMIHVLLSYEVHAAKDHTKHVRET
jgi:hypothetical protein